MSSRKDVQLIPINQGGQFKWKVVHGGQSGDSPATYPKVKLPPDSGPHLIIFELSGNHSGITFSGDPMWVRSGSKPNQSGMDPQIAAAIPMEQGKKLVVLDRNDNDPAVQLHYRLNFVNALPLDPIIENGGKTFVPAPPPEGFLGTSMSAVSILAAVTLFIVGLVIGRIWARP